MNESTSLVIRIICSFRLLDEAMTALLGGVPGFSFWDEVETEISPDVILLAIPDQQTLPDTLSAVMQQHPESRVLILFWEWTPRQVQLALNVGASGCLDLYLTKADFVAVIRQAARGEVVFSPDLQQALVIAIARAPASTHVISFEDLTEREQEVLELVCQGLSNKQIAQRLYLSVRTIENHLRRIYQKLGIGSRTEAVVLAMQQGWIDKH
jgi:DNA-binding NarL/FixJ family response regulator